MRCSRRDRGEIGLAVSRGGSVIGGVVVVGGVEVVQGGEGWLRLRLRVEILGVERGGRGLQH